MGELMLLGGNLNQQALAQVMSAYAGRIKMLHQVDAATQQIKLRLVLAKIAETEKLQVTEQDIDAFVYSESIRTQQKPEKLIKVLTSDRDQLRAVQQSIIFDKAIDFLVSKATVTTIQLPT